MLVFSSPFLNVLFLLLVSIDSVLRNYRICEVASIYCTSFYFIDIDECAGNSDNCHVNATCSNTVGGFTCQCNEGFEGNGTHCVGTL